MTFRHDAELELLKEALDTLQEGFSELPETEPCHDPGGINDVLQDVARRMRDNFPYHHPDYAGQMLKPPHPVARLAYALSLWLNPNNHALDGGRASSVMELECIAALAAMFGFRDALGHLCGGGTMANLEALWVAGQLRPRGPILASSQAHYTHRRISEVLRLEFAAVPITASGAMDVDALRARLSDGEVSTVVATLGTTGVGAVDPLAEILELRDEHGFRVHVDAAYGGYFHIASELHPENRRHFDRVRDADSLVIDPHKHGLQPYGCGSVLFRDAAVARMYKHESTYTYFTAGDLHLGEISLECSRPGAAAVALWATQKLLPMTPGGQFAAALDHSLIAARSMYCHIKESENYIALMPPELDIVVFAADAGDAVRASERARRLFELAAARNIHLALIDLPVDMVSPYWPALEINRDTVTCLRSCLMKPEHLGRVADIWRVLEELGRECA